MLTHDPHDNQDKLTAPQMRRNLAACLPNAFKLTVMDTAEVFSALGTPARTAARILLAPRYIINGFAPLRGWSNHPYALARYGPSYRWRMWLLFDIKDLEDLEGLINDGTDEDVLHMREAKLEQFKLVALVGALLATLALQAMTLPLLTEATFVVRASLTVSTMLSLLATFFTCIQQRELGSLRTAPALRMWLSNGVHYPNATENTRWQSSLASLTLMEAPYELISLAVANFVAGIAAYMWSVWKEKLDVQKEDGLQGVAVLVYFAVGTGFAFTMFPVLLGSKDRERRVALEGGKGDVEGGSLAGRIREEMGWRGGEGEREGKER